MNVTLTSELAEYVTQKIASGRYTKADDVVHDALRLLQESDEKQKRLDELRREIDVGIKQADAGEVGPLNTAEILAEIRSRRAGGERKGA
jgi:antitoxin ParD1/3/4